MHVAIIGAGLMGSQIAAEYALGGHAVQVVARSPEAANDRVAAALALAEEMGIATAVARAQGRQRLRFAATVQAVDPETSLVVESVAEDLTDKVEVFSTVAAAAPLAILATNTSSLSILEIGEAAGVAERLVGTHYWNPPLLMPLVEVVCSERTRPGIVENVTEVLRGLGKRPVLIERDVPGFVWNRMQLALLREAVWLVEQGVASPAAVDEIVRDGLARRWRYTGPFQTAALGGAATFERIAANLWPQLSAATEVRDLGRWLPAGSQVLADLRTGRDVGLRDDLLADRHAGPEPCRKPQPAESEPHLPLEPKDDIARREAAR